MLWEILKGKKKKKSIFFHPELKAVMERPRYGTANLRQNRNGS